MIQLYLKKPQFWPIVLHFGQLWAILEPTIEILEQLYKPFDHLFICFPTIYDTVIFEKHPFLTIFGTFFGPLWSILGPNMKILNNLYKGCIHLTKSFPTIYHTTIFGEYPFLTIFAPFLGHFGPFWAQKGNFWKTFTKFDFTSP